MKKYHVKRTQTAYVNDYFHKIWKYCRKLFFVYFLTRTWNGIKQFTQSEKKSHENSFDTKANQMIVYNFQGRGGSGEGGVTRLQRDTRCKHS